MVVDSPAVDTGNNELLENYRFDLNDNLRVSGQAIDMGAFEFQQ